MATSKPSSKRKIGGRLVLGVTDLGAAYPYGGTEIGMIGEIVKDYRIVEDVIVAEEFGAVVETPISAEEIILGCNLRGWDDAAIRLLPGGKQVGATTRSVIDRDMNTDAQRAGALPVYYRLLHVPDDPVNGLGWLGWRCSYLRQLSAQVRRSYSREYGNPVFFRVTMDQYGRTEQEGLFTDLSLANP